jgi:hypothetical protein
MPHPPDDFVTDVAFPTAAAAGSHTNTTTEEVHRSGRFALRNGLQGEA